MAVSGGRGCLFSQNQTYLAHKVQKKKKKKNKLCNVSTTEIRSAPFYTLHTVCHMRHDLKICEVSRSTSGFVVGVVAVVVFDDDDDDVVVVLMLLLMLVVVVVVVVVVFMACKILQYVASAA